MRDAKENREKKKLACENSRPSSLPARRTSAIYRQKFHTDDVSVNFVMLPKSAKYMAFSPEEMNIYDQEETCILCRRGAEKATDTM